MREAASEIVDDAVYRARLKERAIAGKLAPAVEVALWYYSKGKPRENVDLNAAVDYRWLSDDDDAADDQGRW